MFMACLIIVNHSPPELQAISVNVPLFSAGGPCTDRQVIFGYL